MIWPTPTTPKSGLLWVEICSSNFGRTKSQAKSIYPTRSISPSKTPCGIWKYINLGKPITMNWLLLKWSLKIVRIIFVCRTIPIICCWRIFPLDCLMLISGSQFRRGWVFWLSSFQHCRLWWQNLDLSFSLRTWLVLRKLVKSRYGSMKIYQITILLSYLLKVYLYTIILLRWRFRLKKGCFNAYLKFLGLLVTGKLILSP